MRGHDFAGDIGGHFSPRDEGVERFGGTFDGGDVFRVDFVELSDDFLGEVCLSEEALKGIGEHDESWRNGDAGVRHFAERSAFATRDGRVGFVEVRKEFGEGHM